MYFHEHFHKNHKKFRVLHIILMILAGVILATLFALSFAVVVKFLWNWLMPDLFGLKIITFWQAFGIILLGKLIFGNFGPGHHRKHHHVSHKIDKRWHKFFGVDDENKNDSEKNGTNPDLDQNDI